MDGAPASLLFSASRKPSRCVFHIRPKTFSLSVLHRVFGSSGRCSWQKRVSDRKRGEHGISRSADVWSQVRVVVSYRGSSMPSLQAQRASEWAALASYMVRDFWHEATRST